MYGIFSFFYGFDGTEKIISVTEVMDYNILMSLAANKRSYYEQRDYCNNKKDFFHSTIVYANIEFFKWLL